MKDISKLTEYIGKFTDKVIENVAIAQQETAKEIWGDVINIADEKIKVNTGDYISSIQISPTVKEGKTIKTEIYTDEVVKTKNGTSYNLGFLLETGTDPHAIPNAFGWGDRYGYDSIQYKRTLSPEWHPGTISRPHFKPALEKNKMAYKENIARAVKEAE